MYKIKIITEENVSKAIEFLKKYEVFCLDLTSEVLRLRDRFSEMVKKIFCFAFLCNERIIGLFVFNEHKTFLYCFPEQNPKTLEAFFICTKNFFTKYRIASIVGTKYFAEALKDYLIKHFAYTLIKREEYFLLEKKCSQERRQCFEANGDLKFSISCLTDVDKLLQIELAYEREELEIDTSNEYFSRFYLSKMIREQTVFKCENKSKIIARVHTNAIGINAVQLGGVYTVPEFRRRGISKKLIEYAINYLSNTKRKFVLFVKVKNKPAIALYKALAFKKIDDFQIIKFKTS